MNQQYDPWQRPADDSPAAQMPDAPGAVPGGYQPYQEFDPDGVRRHSGLGIASLILALLSLLLMAIPLIYGIVLAVQAVADGRDPAVIDETDPALIAVGCAAMVGMLTALIGTGLGIGALFLKNRKKWPAITGLIINGGLLLLFGGMTLLGMIMNAA